MIVGVYDLVAGELSSMFIGLEWNCISHKVADDAASVMIFRLLCLHFLKDRMPCDNSYLAFY